jgi:diguanylate cyclase (GGDEF)-like protein
MSMQLLVVEDSKPIARVIRQIGEALNYQVTVATTLAEVESILQGNTDFFAATIDYALPDAPNGEAIAYVLSHSIPSVVMTGKMDETTRQQILAQPVVDYIPKENSQAFLYLKRILHWQITNSSTGILVVDDSLAARNYVSQLLKRRNFNVYLANDGVQALERLKQHKDIKNGADDFLRKPFCPEEFYCRITQNIENLNNIEQIQKAANVDYLTDLPNRRAFFSKAEQLVPQYIKRDMPYCVAMIDIDFFKKINDNYGNDAGDHVLKVLALYMRKHLGSGLLARLGGEEFAVLMYGVDEDQLYTKLDDLRRDISVSQLTFEEHHIAFNISIGLVCNSTETFAKQLNQAESALYNAKENGRNQLSIFGVDD